MRSWLERIGLVSLLGFSLTLGNDRLNSREGFTSGTEQSSNSSWFINKEIEVLPSSKYLDRSVSPENMESVDFDYKAVVFLNKLKLEDINRVKEIAKMEYWEVIERINNPNDAAIYCSRVLKYGKAGEDGKPYDTDVWGRDFWQSFKITHENPSKEGDCDDIAIAAAALLQDNGFPPYVLFYVVEEEEKGHMVFIYKDKNDRLGTIGGSYIDTYPSATRPIETLIRNINFSEKAKRIRYNIFDLRMSKRDFVEGDYSLNMITGEK